MWVKGSSAVLSFYIRLSVFTAECQKKHLLKIHIKIDVIEQSEKEFGVKKNFIFSYDNIHQNVKDNVQPVWQKPPKLFNNSEDRNCESRSVGGVTEWADSLKQQVKKVSSFLVSSVRRQKDQKIKNQTE